MTLVQVLSVLVAWAATSVVVALVIGRIIRNAEITEVCVEPGCDCPATHERLVGVITDAVPAGDADGFSEVVELACGRHGEVRRS